MAAFDCRHISFALFGGEIVSHCLRRAFVMNDFGICARDDEFARPAAESRRRFFINLKISVENFRFKVGDFFEKMTLLAVAVRIGRRKLPFVMTGDKSQMIFVFIEQLDKSNFKLFVIFSAEYRFDVIFVI